MAREAAAGQVQELLKEKGSVLECRASGVPPLNLLCRKPVFLGLLVVGQFQRSVLTSPGISLESGLLNLKFPCCACGTGIQTILCAR